MFYALTNRSTGATIAERIVRPKGWYHRTLGLLDRKHLLAGEGLWLDRCWGVHTVCMRFPIDVLFMDETFRIAAIEHAVEPGRLAVAHARSHHVFELAAGTAAMFDLLTGDRMTIEGIEFTSDAAAS